MDEVLARILRRFLTEKEPGYSSEAYISVGGLLLTVDGSVELSEEEENLLMWVVRGEETDEKDGACYG